uniref:Uncharacterized protein n=1 Tax=Oryza barthii TaxID=65489 RepID=A0A0D3GBV5_9ORYZ
MVMQTSAQQWAAERVGNEVPEPRGWMRVERGRRSVGGASPAPLMPSDQSARGGRVVVRLGSSGVGGDGEHGYVRRGAKWRQQD